MEGKEASLFTKKLSYWKPIIMFIGPVMIFYSIFTLYPITATLYYSFHKIIPRGGFVVTEFIGLQNFVNMFSDDIFVTAVKNTATWGIVGPIIEIITSTSLAIVIFFKLPLHRLFRATWFLPVLVSGVIVGLVFRWIFNFEWGIINTFLRMIGLDIFAVNWLGRRDTPLAAVIFVHWWATFGNSFVLVLAGLSAIQNDLIEAAHMDGANRFQIISNILLPLLKPTLVTVTILSFMGKMRAFDVVWVLTNGGPIHSSETVATYIQKRAFYWNSIDMGYPSSIAIFWSLVVLISVFLIRRMIKSWQE
jgi:ABC-type sugar transport system permease subunit